MKWLLIFVIRVYWFILPPNKRNRCLFKISCSNAVYNATKQNGFFAGVKLLHFRYIHCRSNYKWQINNNEFSITTANGTILNHNEIREEIINYHMTNLPNQKK